MNEILTTVVGNAVTDVTLKTLPSGRQVATFRIANNPRKFDKSANNFVDLDPNFLQVNCWAALAENVSNSIQKGQPLVVFGKLKIKQVNDGDKNSTFVEIDAISIGHDLAKGVAEFTKIRKNPEFYESENWAEPKSGTQKSVA
jgi:single-strand DNA-binding protein